MKHLALIPIYLLFSLLAQAQPPIEIDPVVVTTGKKAVSKLRKLIRAIQPVNWYEPLCGNFEVSFEEHTIEGALCLTCFPDEHGNVNQALNRLEITTPSSDTTSLPELRSHIKRIIFRTIANAMFHPAALMNQGIILHQNGLDGQYMSYTIIRKVAEQESRTITYVDKNRIVQRITLSASYDKEDSITLDASYATNAKGNRLYPTSIICRVSRPSMKQWTNVWLSTL